MTLMGTTLETDIVEADICPSPTWVSMAVYGKPAQCTLSYVTDFDYTDCTVLMLYKT